LPIAFVIAGGNVSRRLDRRALVELHRLTLISASKAAAMQHSTDLEVLRARQYDLVKPTGAKKLPESLGPRGAKDSSLIRERLGGGGDFVRVEISERLVHRLRQLIRSGWPRPCSRPRSLVRRRQPRHRGAVPCRPIHQWILVIAALCAAVIRAAAPSEAGG
jgi:hypothetical protein